jgi:hypothetical protein
MKTFKDHMTESEHWMLNPAEGDEFAIELADGALVESYILETVDDCILLAANPEIVSVLESWNMLSDQESDDSVILETMGYGTLVGEEDLDENTNAVLSNLTPDQIKGVSMMLKAGHTLPDIIRIFDNKITQQQIVAIAHMNAGMAEAKYHGREVPLGKPMAGDVKKSKVYVRDPATGNIKKVNFGDPNMRIKKSSAAHRKSFRARHHCENPGPRTRARYWSCRAW